MIRLSRTFRVVRLVLVHLQAYGSLTSGGVQRRLEGLSLVIKNAGVWSLDRTMKNLSSEYDVDLRPSLHTRAGVLHRPIASLSGPQHPLRRIDLI